MKDKNSITALVPTYNSERYIRGCLESVKWVDEIIVIDGFSSDRTVEIARQYTDNVFQDSSGYSARVNMGIDRAASEWILQINSNERIPEALREEILQAISTDAQYESYYIPRLNYFWGKTIEERPGTLYLYPKGAVRYPCVARHEVIPLIGKVGCLRTPKIHWAAFTIEETIEKWNNFTSDDARAVFAGHHCAFLWKRPVIRANLWNMLYRPLAGFAAAYFLRRGFRHGMHGFVLAVLNAFYYFLEIAKLWELQYKRQHNSSDQCLPLD